MRWWHRLSLVSMFIILVNKYFPNGILYGATFFEAFIFTCATVCFVFLPERWTT